MARYDFASDNTAPATPEAMAALGAANTGFASGYGTDHISARAADLVRELLDADAEVRFVASGTAANAISLAALCRPFEAVVAHEHAHVCTDETGAPGYFGQGLGLIRLPGVSGRIAPNALADALAQPDVSHRQSPATLSLTNATEYGTVYAASMSTWTARVWPTRRRPGSTSRPSRPWASISWWSAGPRPECRPPKLWSSSIGTSRGGSMRA